MTGGEGGFGEGPEHVLPTGQVDQNAGQTEGSVVVEDINTRPVKERVLSAVITGYKFMNSDGSHTPAERRDVSANASLLESLGVHPGWFSGDALSDKESGVYRNLAGFDPTDEDWMKKTLEGVDFTKAPVDEGNVNAFRSPTEEARDFAIKAGELSERLTAVVEDPEDPNKAYYKPRIPGIGNTGSKIGGTFTKIK